MDKCINTKHPEFIELAKQVNMNPLVLKSKIGVWQEKNNSDDFPTLEELGIVQEAPNLGSDNNIKEGVPELFDSNPELANAVYEALGLTTINESEITYTDEEGNPCAKMGGRSSKFTKGSKWEIVKDLKGYPSHAQGGVDIKLGKNGFSFTRNNGVIEAKHGLVLPKIK